MTPLVSRSRRLIEVWGTALSQVDAGTADQARVNVPFGRMKTNPAGLFDDQQVGIFVNDIKEVGQVCLGHLGHELACH